MACNKCGEKPKKACGAFPKAVIEIDNPEKIVLLRKVMVPASMGNESTFPPTIGKYHNVLLEYEASGGIYLYSSDGIPTKLSSDVTELQAQLNALRVRVGEEEVARADADTALSDRITSLDDSLATVAKTGSYNDLSNKPTIGNGTLTIKKNGSNVGAFTANATTNTDVNIVVPTKTSDLANDGSDGASTYVESNDLATVATSGSYNDLTNKPTIGNATLTIKRNDTNAGTFTANATTNKSINIAVPTKTSDLTNDGANGTSTYVESDDLPTVDTTYSSSSNNAIANSTVTNSLDRNVMTNLAVDSTPSTTTVNLSNTKTNLAYPSSSTTSSISLPVASSTQAGIMNSATFDAVTNNTNNINAILNGAVAISNLPASPTQAQLTTAWENETGLTSLINRASVYDVTNNKVWTYYTNDQTWHAASNTSQVTVNTFTNSSEGTIKGSTNDGQVFAESDGTGSVNGWDTLTGNVANNTSKLATIAQGAEVNVQANWTQTNTSADDYIKNKPANLVQDASYVHTDNNFTTALKNKLDGIESGAEVNVQADWSQTNTSADDYIKNKPTIPTVNNATLTIQKNGTNVQTFTANSSTNKTANITVPTAVSELTNDAGYATTTQLNNGLATKQNTLTAGDNIQINGNTISATDTTYTAGNAIDITNGEISADIHPADFFTAEDTVSDCGSDLSLDDTMASTLKSVELKGDAYQQTYSGVNFYNVKDVASASSSGVSVDDDGWITLAMNNTGSSTQYVNYFSNKLAVQTNTDYLIVVEIKDFTSGNNGTLSIAGTSNSEQFKANSSLNISFSTMQKGVSTYIRKSVADFTDVTYGLRTTLVVSANTNRSVTFRISVLADTSITPETFVYQPFTGNIPAPNPDYPQEIQVVTGEQTVRVNGENLFNPALFDGITAGANGGYVTSKYYTASTEVSFNLTPNTNYVLSIRDGDGNLTGQGWSPSIDGVWKNISSGSVKITTDSSGQFTLKIGASSYSNIGSYERFIQLEEGSTATTYEPYQSQSYEINLIGKNLLRIKDSSVTVNGVTYTPNVDGSFSLSGTATANANIDVILPLSSSGFRAGEQYTLSTNNYTSGIRYFIFNCDADGTWRKTLASFSDNQPTSTFTLPDTIANYVNLSIRVPSGITIDASGIKTMIEQGSIATEFAPYLTPIELCKIGDYQDYIYKSGDDWYIHKACGSLLLDGTETWGYNAANAVFVLSNYVEHSNDGTAPYSNYFTGQANVSQFSAAENGKFCALIGNGKQLLFKDTSITTANDFKTWLSSHNTIVYYPLATPTDTKITDTALVAQLNALAKARSYNDQTNIIVTTAGENLPATLCVEAYRKSLSGVIGLINENACTCGERATHLVLSNPTTATWGETGSIAIPLSDGSAVVMGTFASTDVVFTKDDSTTMTVGDLYTALTNGESFEIDLPFGEINSACARDSAAIVATVENVKLDGSSKQTLDQTSQGRLSEMYTSSVPVAVILPVPGGVLLDERFGVEHLMIDDGDTMTSSYRFVVNTYSYHEPLN